MEPEKKIVTFPVWDLDTDEIIEMTMDEEDYKAMVAAEEAYDKEQEERRKRRDEEDADAWRYARDD
jgi:hypothetical protein